MWLWIFNKVFIILGLYVRYFEKFRWIDVVYVDYFDFS